LEARDLAVRPFLAPFFLAAFRAGRALAFRAGRALAFLALFAFALALLGAAFFRAAGLAAGRGARRAGAMVSDGIPIGSGSGGGGGVDGIGSIHP
jgi:hypothetical protein